MPKLSQAYLNWSKKARIRQVEIGISNKQLAENLCYSKQFVTAVVNGRKESSLAIQKISHCLGIEKPDYKK